MRGIRSKSIALTDFHPFVTFINPYIRFVFEPVLNATIYQAEFLVFLLGIAANVVGGIAESPILCHCHLLTQNLQ